MHFLNGEDFFEICKQFNLKPAEACLQFALHIPGVKSMALNTTDAKRVKEKIDMVNIELPVEFWEALQLKGLIEINFFSNLEQIFENKKSSGKKKLR